jgi:3',5'-cyclic AMP phosphodiesterase CpdA
MRTILKKWTGPAVVALFFWGIFFIRCSGANNDNSFRFAFLTDIHLEPTPAALRGFESAIDRVNTLRPAFVIMGGDLIADALGQKKARVDSLYDLYIHECGRFQMPVYNAIGNHEYFGVYRESGIPTDDPEFGKAMFKKWLGNGRTSRSFDYKAWHFILLDGISITRDRNYIGKADSSAIAWLKDDLSRIDKNRNVALVTHIPLVTASTQFLKGPLAANDPWLVVSNGDSILNWLKPYRLRLMLQGHLHMLETIRWRDAEFITGGAVSGAWWKGAYEGFDPGFVVLDVKGDGVSWRFEKIGSGAAASSPGGR